MRPELYLPLSARTNVDIIVILEGLIDCVLSGTGLLVFQSLCPLWPCRRVNIIEVTLRMFCFPNLPAHLVINIKGIRLQEIVITADNELYSCLAHSYSPRAETRGELLALACHCCIRWEPSLIID